jgi:hypothetical protein
MCGKHHCNPLQICFRYAWSTPLRNGFAQTHERVSVHRISCNYCKQREPPCSRLSDLHNQSRDKKTKHCCSPPPPTTSTTTRRCSHAPLKRREMDVHMSQVSSGRLLNHHCTSSSSCVAMSCQIDGISRVVFAGYSPCLLQTKQQQHYRAVTLSTPKKPCFDWPRLG